ncbi:MAG: hypothetical protein APF80_11645 [Alphaproteobacteria bacterium BRH_c36]|nr:MAG: hypothetical protein APF80_11645 [Alphaproteobacteria bacterium BRH_c36]
MSENVAGRLQQTIAAAIILALGLWVAFVSFSVSDPQPYLFPQLISVAMVGLAALALVRAARGANRTGAGMSLHQLRMIAPAIALMLAYVLIAIPTLGFYTAATLAFFTLYTLFDPSSHQKPSTWLVRIAVTVGFMALIYVVFAMGLRVQTPRGLFI